MKNVYLHYFKFMYFSTGFKLQFYYKNWVPPKTMPYIATPSRFYFLTKYWPLLEKSNFRFSLYLEMYLTAILSVEYGKVSQISRLLWQVLLVWVDESRPNEGFRLKSMANIRFYSNVKIRKAVARAKRSITTHTFS